MVYTRISGYGSFNSMSPSSIGDTKLITNYKIPVSNCLPCPRETKRKVYSFTEKSGMFQRIHSTQRMYYQMLVIKNWLLKGGMGEKYSPFLFRKTLFCTKIIFRSYFTPGKVLGSYDISNIFPKFNI